MAASTITRASSRRLLLLLQSAAPHHPAYPRTKRRPSILPSFLRTERHHEQQTPSGGFMHPLLCEEKRMQSWEMTEQSLLSMFFLVWSTCVILLTGNHALSSCALPASPFLSLIMCVCVRLVYTRSTRKGITGASAEQSVRFSAEERERCSSDTRAPEVELSATLQRHAGTGARTPVHAHLNPDGARRSHPWQEAHHRRR